MSRFVTLLKDRGRHRDQIASIGILLLALAPVIFIFQNCGKGFQSIGSAALASQSGGQQVGNPQIIFTSQAPPTYTNGKNLTFSFGADPSVQNQSSNNNLTYRCRMDSGEYTSCASPVPITVTQEGPHTFYVQATNLSGGTAQIVQTWVSDFTAPSVVINTPPPSMTNSTIVNVAFTATDTISGVASVECSLDNSAFSPCTSPFIKSGLSASSHSLRIQAADQAGNPSVIETAAWAVDPTVPTVTITPQFTSPTNKTNPSFTFTALDNGMTLASGFQCQMDGGSFASCMSPYTSPALIPGNHTFGVKVTNGAGTTSAVATVNFTIDVTGPVFTKIQGPADCVAQFCTDTMTFFVTDSQSSLATTCSTNGGAPVSCSSPYEIPVSAAATGSQTVSVVATDAAGNSTIASVTWTISSEPTPWTLSLVAGTIGGPGNLDGSGNSARFNYPAALVADSYGNIYVADTVNNSIRKITPAGVVTTFAGTSTSGFVDGTGSAARFSEPCGITIDSAGNLYVVDSSNAAIRKITPTGVVSTVPGTRGAIGTSECNWGPSIFDLQSGITVDPSGNLYVVGRQDNVIRKITPTGTVSVVAGTVGVSGAADGAGTTAKFNNPTGIAIDSKGDLFVADTQNNTIRKITPAGVVSTFAGTAGSGGFSDGTGAAASFSGPTGLAIDSSDNLYVAEMDSSRIRKITPAAVVSTVAGQSDGVGWLDGSTSAALFSNPSGIAVDSAGNLYVADTGNNSIRKISTSSVVSTLAGASFDNCSYLGVYLPGVVPFPSLCQPAGLTLDQSGNIYAADLPAYVIRKITPAGLITSFAGSPGISGSADGTGTGARFYVPWGITTDSVGNFYVADRGNNNVRKITPSGVVTTFAGLAGSSGTADGVGSAARFRWPTGITVDAANNLYVTDAFNLNVRKITPLGLVTTLTSSMNQAPMDIKVDPTGALYVLSGLIREISPAGVSTTFSGTANGGYVDGAATIAAFNQPSGITMDPSGNIYVADTDNNVIRKITPNGFVTTIVGSSQRFGIDPARGTLYQPRGISYVNGKLYISAGGAILTASP